MQNKLYNYSNAHSGRRNTYVEDNTGWKKNAETKQQEKSYEKNKHYRTLFSICVFVLQITYIKPRLKRIKS